MTTVVFDISMSMDGYITASGITREVPLGVDGERLHDWAFGGDPVNAAYLKRSVEGNGAVITGRVNYGASIPWWGADGPTGPVRRPVFVVTHAEPVTDGIEAALDKARAAAGDRQVTIMGGARLGCGYLRAGLVDEVSLHLVPVLFGGGIRMFEHLADEHIDLEILDVLTTPSAIHTRFAVNRSGAA
jgi:dihydrofolate reductase